MSFLEKKNLYRIEITERCYIYPLGGNAMPSFESVIPVGMKGWVIERWGKKYFRPDEN